MMNRTSPKKFSKWMKRTLAKKFNKWYFIAVGSCAAIVIVLIGYLVTNTQRQSKHPSILKVNWSIGKPESPGKYEIIGYSESTPDIFKQSTEKSQLTGDIHQQAWNIVPNMMANMDKEKNPCDDFWLLSCGGYIKSHPYLKSIEYNRKLNVKAEMKYTTDKEVIGLLEERTTESTFEPVKLVKKIYNSCIDKVTIQKTMKEFLLNLSVQLGGVPLIDGHRYSHDQVMALFALLRETGELPWIQYYILDDPKYFHKIIKLRLKTNCNTQVLSDFVATMRVLFSGDFRLDKIIEFCERVSQISHSFELSKYDDFFNGQRFNEKEITKYLSGFDLASIFRYIILISPENINKMYFITDDIFNLKKFAQLVLETDTSDFMNIAFLEIFDNFYGLVPIIEKYFADTIISSNEVTSNDLKSDLPSMPPLKHTCLDVAYLAPNILEWMYNEKYFDELVQEEAYNITKYLMKAMKNLLSEIKWLNKETRKMGIDKLEKLSRRIVIGSQHSDDKKDELIRNYANINITDNFFTNIIHLKNKRLELQTLAMLQNKLECVTDMDIEAVYNIVNNSIYIPIALMKPPLFYKGAPMAVNFGGLGVVIGHAILHAFDVDFTSFYFNGKWLKDDCLDKYNELKKHIEDIYSDYKVQIMNYTVDGQKTVKENIADIGALKIAYEGYLLWKEDNRVTNITLPILGMTDLQLFFMEFAQSQCSSENPEEKQYYLRHAVDPPLEARVQVPLQNLKNFAEAFGCQKHSKMNPQRKIKMWNN